MHVHWFIYYIVYKIPKCHVLYWMVGHGIYTLTFIISMEKLSLGRKRQKDKMNEIALQNEYVNDFNQCFRSLELTSSNKKTH